MRMSSVQTPIVKIGTQTPLGRVVAIKTASVSVDTGEGIKDFPHSQIERIVL
jgi:ribosomal protein L7Ae-like RNA K-turn-binding protein